MSGVRPLTGRWLLDRDPRPEFTDEVAELLASVRRLERKLRKLRALAPKVPPEAVSGSLVERVRRLESATEVMRLAVEHASQTATALVEGLENGDILNASETSLHL